MRKTFYTILALCVASITFAQQQEYFNNTYQHENNFAIGMTILETDDGYVGYGGTEEIPIFGQRALFYKIDKQGGETIWKSYAVTNSHYYYGNVGGAMVKTSDGNFVMANTHGIDDVAATLFKVSPDLDTIWKKDYNVSISTIVVNCIETLDKGFILVGWVVQSEEGYFELLLMKTDSLGNYQWHKAYGDVSMAQKGTNVIETPDGGYLIGGLNWDPPVYHSMDAMVIKTDSLGNEEWVKYYGNLGVDDGMALLAMADDGDYLVAMVYGVWEVSPTSRTGRISLLKIDNEGNTIWQKKIGPKDRNVYLKNLRHTFDGNLIASGWAYNDTISDFIYEGLLYKFSQQGDSIWMRDYYYYHDQYDLNKFYDVSPTSDNGYIAVGKARPDWGGASNKMWIVKVDSMGCDTAGCATGVFVEELSPSGGGRGEDLYVWPNPVNNILTVGSDIVKIKGEKTIVVYNSQGIKVEEIFMQIGTETLSIDVSLYNSGLYYLQVMISNEIIKTTKFIKN